MQEITINGIVYVVKLDGISGTITNKETGKLINSTSSIGTQVMNAVDWDKL